MTRKLPRHWMDVVWQNKIFPILTITQKAAIYNVCHLYWQAECPEIRIDYGLAGGLRKTDWERHSKDISMVLDQILPLVKLLWKEQRDIVDARLHNLGLARRSSWLRKDQRKKNKNPFLTDNDKKSYNPVVPIEEERNTYHPNHSDRLLQQKARDTLKSTSIDKGVVVGKGIFTDSTLK